MDAIVVDGNRDEVRERNVVTVQVDTDDEVRTGSEQATTDLPPSSLYPLITSMKPFGICFTRNVVRETPAATSQAVAGRLGWNHSRIYATILLAVTWFNAARNCVIFDGSETLGAELLRKLGTIPGVLLIAFLHTTYYVASHTGGLDAIFRQVNSSADDFSVKFRRRAKMVTAVCWLLVATAMNYIIVSFLYGQFDQLNVEFGKSVGDRGEFGADFAQFRRRHQAISRSVQEADRFLMISNAAYFCCQVTSIIVVFYNTIFYRDDTIALDPAFAVLYVGWLSISVLGLSLTAGQAIILNHMAHKLGDKIHDIDVAALDGKTVSEMNIFLSRLNGEPIGVSVIGIFVIDKKTILTILGLLITYFTLVVQFATSSTCTSAVPAVPSNCTTTTAAGYY